MALPNSEKITSQIAMLPDAALKQMAMMHKNDPYVLPLIISEDGRRKQMRLAAQAQMGGMPQPKVVDAAVAQMGQPPEEQGIGALPAPNMQRMADGGIAGYGDEAEGMATGGMGGMFDFSQRSEPVLRMAEGGVAHFDGGGWIEKYLYSNISPAERARREALAAQAEADRQTAAPTPYAEERARNMQKVADQGYIRTDPRAMASMPSGKQQLAPGVTPDARPGAAPGAQPAEKQGLGSIAPPTKVLTPEQAKEQAGEFVDFEESRTALRKAETDQESQGARLRTMLADSLPKTPAMEGLEKLLDKQDAATGGEKDKAAGLALLSAGLAIAGGSSRYALQNLKEAIPAVAQYGEALKDIKKMERENMKMRGEIEQARRAEARDDTKLKLQLEEKIGDRKDKINELGIGLTSKIAGTTAEVSSKLWSTSFEAANREKVAGISANAAANAQLNLYKQLGSADPNSALAKGFQMYKQEGMEPRMYSEYVKLATDPMKGEEFQKRYPSFEVYKAGMGGGQGQIYTDNNVNPNAVRTR
jgi:hypothetical protein